MISTSEIITNAQTYSDKWSGLFDSFLSRIHDVATINFRIDEIRAGHVPIDQVTAILDTLAGSAPTLSEIDIPDFTPPETPEIAFSEIDKNIPLLEEVINKLFGDVVNGSYGIDTDDELQLLDRFQDRAVATARQTVEEIERTYANRRFNLPPGTMFGQLEKVQQGIRDSVSQTNREIYIQRAGQFIQARQFAITAGTNAQQVKASIIESWFRMEQARALTDLELFRSQIEEFKTRLFAVLEKARLTVQTYEAEANVFAARGSVTVESARVAIANYEANVRSFLGALDSNLKNAELQLKAADAVSSLRVAAATAGAKVTSNTIAGALSGLNAVVTCEEV